MPALTAAFAGSDHGSGRPGITRQQAAGEGG